MNLKRNMVKKYNKAFSVGEWKMVKMNENGE
jgi:hypothetical protein